jgi:hypothetical protein
MTRFVIPDRVHAAPEADGRLVVLNRNTGSWYLLNRTGADLYQELERTSDVAQVVNRLAERHHDVPLDRIRDDIARLTADLVRRGLLEARTPRQHRVAAAFAFVVALILLRLPYRTSTTVVTTLKRLLANRDATAPEALHHLATARLVTKHYPGRVACLELSLTAVLTAVLLRQRIDWCFGFATDPQTFHSWIEVAGTPVTDPTDEPILPTYRRVARV